MLYRKKQVWFPLLALILIGQLGYIWVYHSNDRRIRKEAKLQLFRSLKQTELEVIELDAASVAWEEEGKEFLYEGEMYDVVKMEQQGDHLVLHCINDHEENKRLRELSRKIWQQQDPVTGKSNTFFKVLPVSWYCDEPAPIVFPQFSAIPVPVTGPDALLQADLHLPSPPPKA